MPITTKLTATLAATVLLLITTIASTSAFANHDGYTGIPGSSIPHSGAPVFGHDVKVRANKGGKWNISGKDGFLFYDKTTLWSGTNSNFLMHAEFDKNTGVFLSGDLTIKGKIPGLGINDAFTVLVTADLISFDFDAGVDNTLIGFGTDNIICSPLLGVDCTTSESVWITLDSVFSGNTTAKLKGTGFALTTVPVPAAVWLFGSGLVFLGAAAKRRRARG